MEACLLITNNNKPKERKGKVLIVNALKEVKQEKNIAYLENKHIQRIYNSYKTFTDEDGFTKIVSNETVLENKGSLNIAQYLSNVTIDVNKMSFKDAFSNWETNSEKLKENMNELFQILK
jgi:type I restriction enzyme M protein